MAYFVELDSNNRVINGVVVSDDVATDESKGVAFLQELYNKTSSWKQTYKDGTRKNYAGVGFKYDASKDAFITPQPYASWTLDDDTCRWSPPFAPPDDDKMYSWDEENTQWYAPQPYPSWTLDEDGCLWEPPTPMPVNDKFYAWDEDTTSWVEIT